jgi:ribosomal protein S18 acetylase RimI-like enzyme
VQVTLHSNSMIDPFENLGWNALNTTHAHLAVGHERARRYPIDTVPFAAVADSSHQDISALGELIQGPDDQVYLVGPEPKPTATLNVGPAVPCFQMVYPNKAVPSVEVPFGADLVTLGPSDVTEMIHVANFSLRGFMRQRTYLLGHHFGIRVHGELVAIAGERMCTPSHREISTVCTHPQHLGKGYAGILMIQLMQAQAAMGAKSFLHVRTANDRAVSLYKRLGFVTQRENAFWPVSTTRPR